jgi:hypothetical protein
MRFVIPVAALALLAAPAIAQTTTAPATTAPSTTAPATTAPAAAPTATTAAPATPAAPAAAAPATPAAPKKMVGHHQTLQQRFDAANTTHDGQLTKDQATAAKWSYVTKNFTAMDAGKKGYVTVDEIRAYAKAKHAAHVKPAAPATAPAAAAPSNS